jgi:signal transduction histidine kinase
MSEAGGEVRTARQKWVAVLVTTVLAGLVDVRASLARQGVVDVPCLVFFSCLVFAELVALNAVFAAALRRRVSGAVALAAVSVAALGSGFAAACAAWAVQATFHVEILGARKVTMTHVAWEGGIDGIASFGLWAIAIAVPFAVRDANARALESEQLRATAELARLRGHLEPHFVLNTLNAVAGLVVASPAEARDLLGALGDLLRDSLTEGGETQTLGDEVEWLKRYAGILEVRHRGALRFDWDIAEETRKVRVPRLLLQPLLENAVKHGALRRRGGGEVQVHTSLEQGDRVRCVIEDNGPGTDPRLPRPGALGIRLLTRRLEVQYRGLASFHLESAEGVTRAIVELPGDGAS